MKRPDGTRLILIVDDARTDVARAIREVTHHSEGPGVHLLLDEHHRLLAERRAELAELERPRLDLELPMKITVLIIPEAGNLIEVKGDINNARRTNVATADLLFADMTNMEQLKGHELRRWELRRGKERWKGLATDKSPQIANGDRLKFFVRKKTVS